MLGYFTPLKVISTKAIVYATSCYYCSSFTDSQCEQTQKRVDCHDSDYDNSLCLTMQYFKRIDGKSKRYFQKRCVKHRLTCQEHCENLERAENCMVSCCQQDFCNEVSDEKVLWFGLIKSAAASSNQRISIFYKTFLATLVSLFSKF